MTAKPAPNHVAATLDRCHVRLRANENALSRLGAELSQRRGAIVTVTPVTVRGRGPLFELTCHNVTQLVTSQFIQDLTSSVDEEFHDYFNFKHCKADT